MPVGLGSHTRRAAILLAAAPALLASGCGGGGTTPSQSADAQAGGGTAHGGLSAKRAAGGRQQSAAAIAAARASTRNIVQTSKTPVKAVDPKGMPDDEVNPSGVNAIDPCTLVSRSQAQAIVHGPVATPVSAPQGPTCIYTPRRGPSPITLAIEGRAFSKVRQSKHLQHRIAVEVSGRTAYCGIAGTPTLLLPLPQGRLLVIAAPCPIAASFAETALPRIPRSAA